MREWSASWGTRRALGWKEGSTLRGADEINTFLSKDGQGVLAIVAVAGFRSFIASGGYIGRGCRMRGTRRLYCRRPSLDQNKEGSTLKPDFYTDFHGWLEQHAGRQYELHDEHINAAFVKMLRTIGFDKGYKSAGEGRICGTRGGISIWTC